MLKLLKALLQELDLFILNFEEAKRKSDKARCLYALHRLKAGLVYLEPTPEILRINDTLHELNALKAPEKVEEYLHSEKIFLLMTGFTKERFFLAQEIARISEKHNRND